MEVVAITAMTAMTMMMTMMVEVRDEDEDDEVEEVDDEQLNQQITVLVVINLAVDMMILVMLQIVLMFHQLDRQLLLHDQILDLKQEEMVSKHYEHLNVSTREIFLALLTMTKQMRHTNMRVVSRVRQ